PIQTTTLIQNDGGRAAMDLARLSVKALPTFTPGCCSILRRPDDRHTRRPPRPFPRSSSAKPSKPFSIGICCEGWGNGVLEWWSDAKRGMEWWSDGVMENWRNGGVGGAWILWVSCVI